ncbi:MAG: hypothetical protein U0572_15285 [Phycisphaerales bacterium]
MSTHEFMRSRRRAFLTMVPVTTMLACGVASFANDRHVAQRAPDPVGVPPGIVPCAYTATVMPIGLATSITVNDINEAGTVVGRATGGGSFTAFAWTPGSALQSLQPPAGYFDPYPRAINNNGWVVLSVQKNGTAGRALVRDAQGLWHEITSSPSAGFTEPTDINDQNIAVGAQSTGTQGPLYFPWKGFTWTLANGKTTVFVPPGPNVGIEGINSSGVLVGWTGPQTGTPGTVAFVIDGAQVTTLPPIPGGVTSIGEAISDDGLVVGTGQTGTCAPCDRRSFAWRGGEMVVVADQPTFNTEVARDVADPGFMTGYTFDLDGNDIGWVWTTTSGFVDLNALLVGADGITVTSVGGVNKKGWIGASGFQTLAGGTLRAVAIVLKPAGIGPDLNCDGVVNAADLELLLDVWGEPAVAADFDGNATVDARDVGILLGAWGEAGDAR